jgi:hypothetical protein
VRVIHALTEGLVFQRLLTPDLMPDEIFRAAFAAGKKAERTNALISDRWRDRWFLDVYLRSSPLTAQCLPIAPKWSA